MRGSATVIDLGNAWSQRHIAARQQWQEQAWKYYRNLPEIRYPANFFGSSLSRFRAQIGLIPADNPNAKPEIIEGQRRPDIVRAAEEQLAALKGPTGGVSEIQNRYGVNMNVAGDGWLIGEDGPSDETMWEFLSVKEIYFKKDERNPDRLAAYRNPGGDSPDGYEEEQNRLGRNTMYRRFWRPHAEYSLQADAAIESLMDDCERLIALNDSITSRLINRLSQSGILFLPSTISVPGNIESTAPTGEGDGPSDPVVAQIINYFQAAIRDRRGATGSVPIIIRGPGEAAEQIVHITLDRKIDEVELRLREETRQTIARGLDLPPEVQQGLSDASHWTSWSVMDSSYRNHLQPAADRFGDSLTKVYIRPALLEDFDADEVERIAVVMDGADVISRPNEAEDGRQLHDRYTISDKALRKRSGAAETDAPDEEEYVRQMGRRMRNPFLATHGLPIHDDIDWDKVATVGSATGRPGVGSLPENRRPADSSDPAGAPGEGDAGGISDGGIDEDGD